MPVSDRLVAVGASAGGVEALANLLVQFDASFPAPIVIVLHVGATSSGDFVRALDRCGPLAVTLARDGETLQNGHVYVAPPDHHLLVAERKAVVAHGPKENRSRPAIDPLFRSAAVAYGPGVIGVLLTGYLDDGVAGLGAILRMGGTAIVQDPDDADFPDLPRNALARLTVDHTLPVLRMGPVIRRLLSAPMTDEPATPGTQQDLKDETKISTEAESHVAREERLGDLAPYACPECHGPLWMLNDPDVRRFRCHVGHAYTETTLADAQADATERALWAALRSLEERANLLASMNEGAVVGVFEERAAKAREHADQLRRLLLQGQQPEAR